jgi:osmoprotectant transport system permease protein
MKRMLLIMLALVLLATVPRGSAPSGVKVASKPFTESVLLGEMLTQMIRSSDRPATHLAQLGGTRIVYDALKRGEIDVYPEYTGTILQVIYPDHAELSSRQLQELLLQDGIRMSDPLGFSNNYAIAVRRETAEKLGLSTISDLAAHPELRLGFSNEFIDRDDGWKNLRTRYNLPHKDIAGLNHDIAYRQLASEVIDGLDVYTTDAQLAKMDLVLLEDDFEYFPRYEAVVLYRADLGKRFPDTVQRILSLEASIPTKRIMDLNALVVSREVSESQAAAVFLQEKFDIDNSVEDISVAAQVWQRTLEHCDLVRRSLIPALFVAIPLGVIAAKLPRLGQIVMALVGIIQTIPALALLVLLIAPMASLKLDTLGSGSATAVAALFLYSLLPIVRNTATGLSSISPEHDESAAALGLSSRFRLLQIELPLASPSILAGIKTAAVLNVGFATLGALVGARGYGQPILTGIRLNDTGLIMQGAVPAACLAVLLQIFFEWAEHHLVPAGLRPLSAGDADAAAHG